MNQRDPHLPVITQSPAAIADVQSMADTREIAIDRVGVKALRHPIRVVGSNGEIKHSVATFDMAVRLAHDVKGTHMSRFVEILESNQDAFSVVTFGALLRRMAERLDATEGRIEVAFTYFIEKSATISGVKSLLDVEVKLTGEIKADVTTVVTKVVVPVTSLCPCSKEIAAYGAHNQRSHISISVRTAAAMTIEDVVRIAEDQASAELYGILKRPDEKFVTERAYDNPKFVEDLVRDVAAALNADERVDAYVVESENFESIHNHSAYAVIERDKRIN
ncbi:MAG: GTP cyclohydrolase FolE2 [Burkholderiales bacterium]|nr:GTP cyclohydrolase FolE2 [Burkholderiales bacterium]